MEVKLRWTGAGLHFLAQAESGHTTAYDSPVEVGGTDQAMRPMEGLLSAMVACFAADVVSILQKKRCEIRQFQVQATAERRPDFPRVFTKAHLQVEIESPNAKPADIERSIELSRTKYCSAMAMFAAAGCEIVIDYTLRTS
ncbi:MAG: OsmC family protein [Bacteroidia bacterium]|nr:OsmC family protein [Bacteroidia bacterium]MDW8088331.1 OsmC family protein [Bacteroidia bacterium]